MLFLNADHNTHEFEDFLKFNKKKYHPIDCWCSKINKLDIPQNLLDQTGNVLILSTNALQGFIESTESNEKILKFLLHNKIIIWNDIDSYISLAEVFPTSFKTFLSQGIKNLWITLDAEPFQNHWLYQFPHLNIRCMPMSNCVHSPRIFGADITKKDCKYDFLLLSYIKPNRPNRPLILQYIQQNLRLKSAGFIKSDINQYFGQKVDRPNFLWYPSMDLVNNSWMEIVGETISDHAHFITEKTCKTIATKTPFVIASSQGYLKYLRKLGFKTFHSLIDESYDSIEYMPDRVKKMVQTVEDIVVNGAEDFYRQSNEILQHNQSRLHELAGSRVYKNDCFLNNLLQEVGV